MKYNISIKYNFIKLMVNNMSLYKHLEYRPALQEIIEKRRKLPGKFTLRKLAEASDLQASFLTNVLKGRFDFNADQLFAVATALELTPSERDYVLLLLDHERSVHKPRRQDLRREIERQRQENLRTEKNLAQKAVELPSDAQAQFYLDPFAQLVLMYLAIPPYNKTPERLGSVLGISQQHLGEILKILIGNGFAAQEKGVYKVLLRDRHLPKRNPLSGPFATMIRLRSLDQLQRLSLEQSYSHTMTFTATMETKEQLSDAYVSFLKKAEAIVRPAAEEHLFQMNFDLFPWSL